MSLFSDEYFTAHFDSDNTISISNSTKPLTLNSVKNKLYNHYHNHYEILYFISGDVEINTVNNKFTPKEREIFIIPPKTLHCITVLSNKPYSRVVLNLAASEENKRLIESIFSNKTEAFISDPMMIDDYIKRFKTYYYSLPNTMFKKISSNLLYEFFCIFQLSVSAGESNKESVVLFNKIIGYINDNFIRINDVEQISKALYISTPYVYKLFKERLDISPKKYIEKRKMQYAQDLIRQGITKGVVAEMVGYSDYTSFYRAYKRTFKIQPSYTPPEKIISLIFNYLLVFIYSRSPVCMALSKSRIAGFSSRKNIEVIT